MRVVSVQRENNMKLYLHGNVSSKFYQALYYNSTYKDIIYKYFYTLGLNELGNARNELCKSILKELDETYNIIIDDTYEKINENGKHIVDDISKVNFNELNNNNKYYFIQFTTMEGLGILSNFKLQPNHIIFSSGSLNTFFDFGYLMRVNFFSGVLQTPFYSNELFLNTKKPYRLDLSIRNFFDKNERMDMFLKLKNSSNIKVSINSYYINKLKNVSKNLDRLITEQIFLTKLEDTDIEIDEFNSTPFADTHNFIKKLIDNTLQSDISIIFESTTNKQYLDDKFRNGYISEKLIDNLLIGKPFIHASMLVNDFLNNNGFNNYSDILEIDYNNIFSDIDNINDRLIIHIKRLAELPSIEYYNIIDKLKIVAETNRQKCLELFEKNSILEDIVNNKI